MVETGQRTAITVAGVVVENGQAVATASATIDAITLSATGSAVATATESSIISPITVSAAGEVIVGATLDAAIGDFGLEATGAVRTRRSDPGVPWWWAAYIRRHAAERAAAAAKKPDPVEGNGVAILPLPFGRGTGFHDPDADAAEFVIAAWLAMAA